MWSPHLTHAPWRELLEAVISNVDEGVTIVDPTGRFIYVNDGAASLLGFQSPAQLLAVEARAVLGLYQVVDEHHQPLTMDKMPAAVAFTGVTPPEALVGWRTNAKVALRWSITRSLPLKGPDGKVQLVISFFRDVTEQRRREAQERLLATATVLFSQSLDMDATFKQLAQVAVPELADWAIVELVDPLAPAARPRRVAFAHADPAKLAYAVELSKQWPSEWDPEAKTGVALVLRTGKPSLVATVTDELLQRAARSEQHLEGLKKLAMSSWLCVPLTSQRDRVIGALTLITAEGRRSYEPADVEFALELGRRAGTAVENARLFAALETANREKDQFLAMLGHELRNPLAPMVNAMLLLENPRTAGSAAAIMQRQLQQLTRLVDDLLDVSRISRGKIELRKEPLDLSALLRDAASDHTSQVEAAGVTLAVDLPGVANVSGDRVRLHQVAGNLLGNAVKFTPRGGRVTLRARVENERAVLEVEDTGAGLDAATLPRLFQPFVQANRSLDRKEGGLGLGLAVVRGIVELHGGEVSARSLGLGHGATFVVTLPLQTPVAESPGLPLADEDDDGPTPARKLRVLVIDDNVDLANTMRDLLSYEAREVKVEHSGLNAVEAIRRMKPDVVICDIGLPEKDGYAIAAEVRADRSLDGVKLVALSGYGLEADKERALSAGFARYLTKPLHPDLLMSLLTLDGDS